MQRSAHYQPISFNCRVVSCQAVASLIGGIDTAVHHRRCGNRMNCNQYNSMCGLQAAIETVEYLQASAHNGSARWKDAIAARCALNDLPIQVPRQLQMRHAAFAGQHCREL